MQLSCELWYFWNRPAGNSCGPCGRLDACWHPVGDPCIRACRGLPKYLRWLVRSADGDMERQAGRQAENKADRAAQRYISVAALQRNDWLSCFVAFMFLTGSKIPPWGVCRRPRCVRVQVSGSLLLLNSIPQAIILLNRSPNRSDSTGRFCFKVSFQSADVKGSMLEKIWINLHFHLFGKKQYGLTLSASLSRVKTCKCGCSDLWFKCYHVQSHWLSCHPLVTLKKDPFATLLASFSFFHRHLIWLNDTLWLPHGAHTILFQTSRTTHFKYSPQQWVLKIVRVFIDRVMIHAHQRMVYTPLCRGNRSVWIPAPAAEMC